MHTDISKTGIEAKTLYTAPCRSKSCHVPVWLVPQNLKGNGGLLHTDSSRFQKVYACTKAPLAPSFLRMYPAQWKTNIISGGLPQEQKRVLSAQYQYTEQVSISLFFLLKKIDFNFKTPSAFPCPGSCRRCIQLAVCACTCVHTNALLHLWLPTHVWRMSWRLEFCIQENTSYAHVRVNASAKNNQCLHGYKHIHPCTSIFLVQSFFFFQILSFY